MEHCHSVNKVHNTSFGFELTKIRTNKDMTRKEMGKLLSVSESSIWAWECGVHLPKIPQVLLICEILDTTPNDLLGF